MVLLSVTKITHSYIKHEQSVKNMECFMIWRILRILQGFSFLFLSPKLPSCQELGSKTKAAGP